MSTAEGHASGLEALGRRLVERWRDHSYLAGESPAPAANASTAPASSVQEGIWLFERLHPGTSVNHLTYCGRVEGDINVYALAEALRVVCTRHDILRTTFREDPADGTLHQVVHPGLIVRPSVQDLTGLPGEERELKAAQAHRALASEPFDLATGPLLRMAVHHLSPRRSFLIVVAHHLIADGWSLSVFFRELAAAYEGEDVAVTLGKPQQYVAAERQHRGGNVDVDDGADPSADTAAATAPDEDAVTYWRRMLSGRLSVELPTDHPRPATPRFRSGTVAVAVPPDVAASVRAVAAATEATPFMVLLTAFQMLLARMTGQEDISVGSPTAMRQRAHAPRVLGPLVNMLVLRTDLTGDPTFRERWSEPAGRAWARTRIRRCPSKSWWRNSSRSGTSAEALCSRPCLCSRTSPPNSGWATSSSRLCRWSRTLCNATWSCTCGTARASRVISPTTPTSSPPKQHNDSPPGS
uniref:Non-ribosomal peptide synthase n=1 Tax=Streptomyces melanovinaceus TaxID=1182637 RepID=A0A0A6ZAS1_9ACTN|nr:non-ribosomal peptide synthase [Streptomyces melanovinaceus]